MQSVLRFLFLGFFIFLSHTVLGQRKVDGTFINIETDSLGIRTENVIKIEKDSIWFERKKYGKNILPGEKYTNWKGDFRHHKTGYNNGPFYSGWLMIMSCDTCPDFWKYTLKSKDSLNIETHVWQYGETDTIINNRDTTYSTPTIMDASDPTDLDRVRELFFTFTKTGDILIDRKLYRRKLKRL